MENERPRSPVYLYFVGILCLVPFIGALAGLVLILYGIITYKDKWLIMMGALGIVITIGTAAYLFVSFERHIIKKGFAGVSQVQLNNLVKEIEFYKLVNGHYPRNLYVLVEANRTDVLQEMNQRFDRLGGGSYNYELMGEKYTLFSSGRDRIPKTADDVYPQIRVTDSSKIGLIKVTDEEVIDQ